MSLPVLTGCIAGSGGGGDSPPCYSGVWIEGTGLPSGLNTYAIDFDGTNDYISYGSAGSGSISESLQPASGTYACWIKKDAFKWPSIVIGAGNTSGSGGLNKNYGPNLWIDYSHSSNPRVMANLGDNTDYALVISAGSLLPNSTWIHLAMTWNSTFSGDSDLSLYINGTADATTVANTGSSSSWNTTAQKASRVFRLGNGTDDTYSWHTNCKMAHAAVWNSRLSASDITSLQTSLPSAVAASDLIAYYDMSDGGGSSTLTDKTGNGYNGTLTNMDAGSAC